MFKFTVVCVILALAVMSEGYVKSHHEDGHHDDRLRGNLGGQQGGLHDSGSHHDSHSHGSHGGSHYPRQQEGLSGVHGHGSDSHIGEGSSLGGGHHQSGHEHGGYKKHGY